MELKGGESIEDLQYKGLKIIQSAEGYRFTSDAVFLAGFADAGPGDAVVDLGTGSGVVALLLAARTGARVTGIEIQPALADRARRSVALNGMEGRVEIVLEDIKTAHRTLGANRFDVAVSNPPYFKADCARLFPESPKFEIHTETAVAGGDFESPVRSPGSAVSFLGNQKTGGGCGTLSEKYSEREIAKFELAVRLGEVFGAARSLLKFAVRFSSYRKRNG